MMDEVDEGIAAAACRIAPILRDLGVTWSPAPGRNRIMPQRIVPDVADVALVLRRLVNDLTPGTRLQQGCMAVEWTDDADGGPDEHICFSVVVHTAPAPAAVK